jgi:signal transduction histidine kinase
VRERAEALRPHLAVTVDAGPLPELPAAVEVAAYRICQEALMNVLRHAAATSCRVRLAVVAGHLELDVDDDGIGVGSPSGNGVGLASMRERAAELGGRCTVASGPGGGTQLAVRLPLRAGRQADR